MCARLVLAIKSPDLLHVPVNTTGVSTVSCSSIVQVRIRVVPVYSEVSGKPEMLTVGDGTV